MTRLLVLVITGLWLAILQSGWISLLPGRDPIMVFPLVVAVIFISEFRPADALVVAVAAGLALDAVSSLPAGTNVILLVSGCYAADFLFRRVFTNQSLLAIFGLQSTTYLCWLGGSVTFRAIRATLFGWPWGESGVWPVWWSVIAGLVCQAAAAGLIIFARKAVVRRLSHGFMIRRRSERF